MPKRLYEVAADLVLAQMQCLDLKNDNCVDKMLVRTFNTLAKMIKAEENGAELDLPGEDDCSIKVTCRPADSGKHFEASEAFHEFPAEEGVFTEFAAEDDYSKMEVVPGESPEDEKASARPSSKPCPVCSRTELVRYHRRGWMKIYPFSKFHKCEYCNSKFLSFTGVRLKLH